MSTRIEDFEQPHATEAHVPKHMASDVIGKSALSGEMEWDIKYHDHPTMVDSGYAEKELSEKQDKSEPRHQRGGVDSNVLRRIGELRKKKPLSGRTLN